MPRTLELGLNRIFRSRWGIAVVLLLVVLAVIGIGRVFGGGGGGGQTPLGSHGSAAPTITVDPSDEDGVVSADTVPSPETFPGKAQPEAVAYAFASAWVDHKNITAKAWRDQLLPNSTENLADQLRGVDPASVPADRVTGRPTLAPLNKTLVNAVVTTDSGKLSLRLIAPKGQWLVDGIDWDPS